VTALLATHGHLDHVGNATFFERAERLIPREGLTAEAGEVIELGRRSAAEWAADVTARERWNLPGFVRGLRVMGRFPADVLCGGHGVALAGDIPAFLEALAAASSL
jgi:mRNA degradation ribonuclease J1/J2